MPAFTLGGKILVMKGAVKAHATLTFWRGSDLGLERNGEAMGQFGRLTDVGQLPASLEQLVRRAAEFSKAGPARAKPG